MNDLVAKLSAAHFGAFTSHDAYEGYHRQSLSQLVRRARSCEWDPVRM